MIVDEGSVLGPQALRLALGCEFRLQAAAPTSAVVQVAPRDDETTIDVASWDTECTHRPYVDTYGNTCQRFLLPAGASRIEYRAEVTTSDRPDEVVPGAGELAPVDLPDDLLRWVMPTRFCQSDELGAVAWERFGHLTPGWSRVQAVCDFVHAHLEFARGSSNPWTTAADVYRSRQGVCRDFAHLAITFCRALNIPTRYVFGYLPDIGLLPPFEPMDFAAWFEVSLDGRWYTFDARNNEPRIGRVVVGRGRDAVDVAMITTFGRVDLVGFEVRADPIG